jgi:hypothetical protein
MHLSIPFPLSSNPCADVAKSTETTLEPNGAGCRWSAPLPRALHKCATCSIPHATRSMQHATHATHDTQHATRHTPHTTTADAPHLCCPHAALCVALCVRDVCDGALPIVRHTCTSVHCLCVHYRHTACGTTCAGRRIFVNATAAQPRARALMPNAKKALTKLCRRGRRTLWFITASLMHRCAFREACARWSNRFAGGLCNYACPRLPSSFICQGRAFVRLLRSRPGQSSRFQTGMTHSEASATAL